jgi:quercetin dioxygenase-like cupin family protein
MLCLSQLLFQDIPQFSRPIVDNERVVVSDVTWVEGKPSPMQPRQYDFITIYITGGPIKSSLRDGTSTVTTRKAGDVAFEHKGTTHSDAGTSLENPARSIVIGLKDYPVQPLVNTSGYPIAFPRPGAKRLLENNRIIIWDYTWTLGIPTPMHFHDKDVVVVFMENGSIRSTTPDGKSSVNDVWFGLTRFSPRDRVHVEELVSGKARAIILELK